MTPMSVPLSSHQSLSGTAGPSLPAAPWPALPSRLRPASARAPLAWRPLPAGPARSWRLPRPPAPRAPASATPPACARPARSARRSAGAAPGFPRRSRPPALAAPFRDPPRSRPPGRRSTRQAAAGRRRRPAAGVSVRTSPPCDPSRAPTCALPRRLRRCRRKAPGGCAARGGGRAGRLASRAAGAGGGAATTSRGAGFGGHDRGLDRRRIHEQRVFAAYRRFATRLEREANDRVVHGARTGDDERGPVGRALDADPAEQHLRSRRRRRGRRRRS